jgi:hypothetical protein
MNLQLYRSRSDATSVSRVEFQFRPGVLFVKFVKEQMRLPFLKGTAATQYRER